MMLGRIAPLVTVAACVAALAGPGAVTGAASSGVETPQLRAVSSRLDGGVSSIVIEATEPVAYVTSQPDPLTVLVDLRNVTAGGRPGAAAPWPPVRGVRVEQSTAADGTPLARVQRQPRPRRLAPGADVAQPHHRRRRRTAITARRSAWPRPPRREPRARAATELRAVRASRSGDDVTVALVGNGELKATTVEEANDMPPRVLLDFHGVAARAGRAGVARHQPGRRRPGARRREQPRAAGDAGGRRPQAQDAVPGRVGRGRRRRAASDLLGRGRTTAAAVGAGRRRVAAPAPRRHRPGTRTGAAVPSRAAACPRRRSRPRADTGRAADDRGRSRRRRPTPVAARCGGHRAGGRRCSSRRRRPGATRSQGPRFTGHPVSLDFQGADLRAVLRTFAEISGLNVVIDPTITGSVDVSLRDVPWDQALDIILKANKLGYYVDGSIVRIAPLGVLADEEAQRRKLADEQALAGELRVFTRPLSYAKAADLVPIITRSALSSRGEVQVDAAHQHRDHPRPARSADRGGGADGRPRPAAAAGGDRGAHRPDTRDFARSLGVEWGFNGRVSPELGNTTAAGVPEHRQPDRPHRAAPGPRRRAHRRQPRRRQRHAARSAWRWARSTAPLNLDVALTALERVGPGPAAVDAAGLDAEQRRSRDHPGRADPDSDGGQQHRHGDLQGRRADPEGDAADHRVEHRDHARVPRERRARLQPRHRSASRPSTPSAR